MSESSPDAPLPLVVAHPGPHTVAVVIDAAALMARADGHAHKLERARLLDVLRRHDLLMRLGRRSVLDAYDAAISRPRDGALPEMDETLDRLSGLAGTRWARLAAAAAFGVASADGVAWPQEIALLRAMRIRLGLDTPPPAAAHAPAQAAPEPPAPRAVRPRRHLPFPAQAERPVRAALAARDR